jgi:hypothetical protein
MEQRQCRRQPDMHMQNHQSRHRPHALHKLKRDTDLKVKYKTFIKLPEDNRKMLG